MKLQARPRVPRVLPTSAYEKGEYGGWGPAPLDDLSLTNGVAKFEHVQGAVSSAEVSFALLALEFMFPFLPMHTKLADDDVVRELVEDKYGRAAGDPWRVLKCQTKKQAMESYGLAALEKYYADYTSVISSTLKDELRPVGKDARLFRPQDISSYIEGARLFHHQNVEITRTGASPVFCRFVVPGRDVNRMFDRLIQLGGENFAADGSQWDAHFPLFVAAIIAEFRIRQGVDRKRAERYYSQMYNGYTLVLNEVLNLVGQPSGHFSTSVDNSLGHVILMAIHAYRSGLTIGEFLDQVRFYCCGDDLIWSTKVACFRPSDVERTYNSCGVYLEFQSYDTLPVKDLVFVGVKLASREIDGRSYTLFSLESSRSFASLHLHKRNCSKHPIFKLAKFASLAILWFADVERFELARAMFQQELARQVRKKTLCVDQVEVKGLWNATNPRFLLGQYMEWEDNTSCKVVLSFGPSWNLQGGLKTARCRRLCGTSLGMGIPCSVVLQGGGIGV